jgi:hypothetical protein
MAHATVVRPAASVTVISYVLAQRLRAVAVVAPVFHM